MIQMPPPKLNNTENDLLITSALPDPSISHFVHSFWMLKNKTGKDIPSTILPNGMVDLALMKMNSANWEMVVRGLDTVPSQITIAADTQLFSIGLKLLAVEYLLGDSIKDVLNGAKSLTNTFWQFEETDLNNLESFCDKATQKIKAIATKNIDNRKKKLFECIYVSQGSITIKELSEKAEVMKKAGLLEGYYALASPMGRTMTDDQGHVLFSKKPTIDEPFNNPEINRNDLRQLLLDSLTSDSIVWDSKLTGLDERNGKWLLHFDKKPNATADFVIGANGGMSAVRKYVTDAEIEYTGTFIIQGDVFQPEINCPAIYQLCNNNILMASGKGNILVANPRNNHTLSYNVIFRSPEEWSYKNGLNFEDSNSITEFLFNKFSHWHECYKQLFRATTFFAGLPTRKIPLDIPWKVNRSLPITLIGDAAHVMPPFAGQGVNIGLVDALILSENLTTGNYKTIQAAIHDYEQKMVVYATEAQQETSQNELEIHRPNFSFLKFIH